MPRCPAWRPQRFRHGYATKMPETGVEVRGVEERLDEAIKNTVATRK
jgi:hypothetical protein